VMDEVLSRAALLALVLPCSEPEGAREQVSIDLRHIALNFRDQFVDKMLMALCSFHDGHAISVLRGFAVSGCREGGGAR
jgi:hypothetical protein